MTRHRSSRHGDGTAWLVADLAHGDFVCHWYTGPNDERLVEQARAATEADAVAWGRLRSTRVRIRTAGASTSWAGTAPKPAGFRDTWSLEA